MRQELEYIGSYQKVKMDLIERWRTQKLQGPLCNGKDIAILGILE